MATLAAILICLWGAPTARGATYLVRPDGTGDFPTIQAAVSACAEGDVVELADGVFRGEGNHDVQVPPRTITLRSQSGSPDNCILDVTGHLVGLDFEEGASRAMLIENLTVTGARLLGVSIRRGSPTVKGCVFTWNGFGNAVGFGVGAPMIQDCRFVNNVGVFGAAIYCCCSEGVAEIVGCEFIGNRATYLGSALFVDGRGTVSVRNCTFIGNVGTSAVAVQTNSTAFFENCTFAANDVGTSQGLIFTQYTSVVGLKWCIIAFNLGGSAGPVQCESGSSVTLGCCDVCGNASGDWEGYIYSQHAVRGNFSLDPLFCDLPHSKPYLSATSPCAPEHSSGCGLVGALPVGCDTPPEPGACCFADGSCGVMSLQDCERAHGSYRGDGIICVPSPCIPIPIDRTTWGRVKSMFR